MLSQTQEQLIDWLSGQNSSHTVVVAAHPDDETVGLGARLHRLKNAAYIVASDGAPANLDDARSAGFLTREDYARARRRELEGVLSLCGIAPERIYRMDFIDQQLCHNLIDLARRVARILIDTGAQAVITHPYEGGHPDHDATAFAVHAACRILKMQVPRAEPCIIEMTSYHLNGGEMQAGVFLPGSPCEPVVLRLSEEERQRKQQLLDRYETQRRTLGMFPLDAERFRFAPQYDFAQPPHAGPLLYDNYEWGVSSARWQELARTALRELESACV